jgi:hypothetical protein
MAVFYPDPNHEWNLQTNAMYAPPVVPSYAPPGYVTPVVPSPATPPVPYPVGSTPSYTPPPPYDRFAATFYPAAPNERAVVIPQDSVPFEVSRDQMVRLTGSGAAGSKIEARVDGPARIVSEFLHFDRKAGKQINDSVIKEFNIQPTGIGKVTVAIIVIAPTLGAGGNVTKYEFEVKQPIATRPPGIEGRTR